MPPYPIEKMTSRHVRFCMAKMLDQVSTLEMSDPTPDAGSVLSFIQNPAMQIFVWYPQAVLSDTPNQCFVWYNQEWERAEAGDKLKQW